MRFKRESKPPVKPGTAHWIKGFLWLPKTIGDDTRWLEFATWRRDWMLKNHPLVGVPSTQGYQPCAQVIDYIDSQWAEETDWGLYEARDGGPK